MPNDLQTSKIMHFSDPLHAYSEQIGEWLESRKTAKIYRFSLFDYYVIVSQNFT